MRITARFRWLTLIEKTLAEESVWEKLRRSEKPVVLYGMGNGADLILDEFATLGIKCSGVFASDGFVRGQSFREFRVEKLSDIEARLCDFTVAVGFATALDSVIENIINISKKHRLVVPCVPVCGKEIINRDFLLKYSEKIEAAFNLLYDEESLRIYEQSVRFMFGGELDVLLDTITEKSTVFNGFFKLDADEDYLDLGAYRGDTIAEFLRFSGGSYSSITAVEPDIKTFRKLDDFCKKTDRCACINACVSDSDGSVIFNNSAGRQSSISANGKEIKSLTVDTICEGRGITYLKADIEGAEKQMLSGAAVTLKNLKPKLNIAAYHRSEDFFEIPLMVNRLNSSYRIFLRRHKYIPCWNLNYYCV